MTLSVTLLASVLTATVVTVILLTLTLLVVFKKLSKSSQSTKAKELKQNKTINYLTENIKQLNSHLQLESTPIAKKLNSFNIDKELVENFVLSEKSAKKELSEKDKKKALKFKI